MPTYVVRLWLPDRPGALGAVASRIGAVRGDLVGIEILEQGGGRAIDELVVDLPESSLVDLLVSEIRQVDGVDVEDVRTAGAAGCEARLDALDTAAVLVEQQTVPDLWLAIVDRASQTFQAEWCALLDLEGPVNLASIGGAPQAPWLAAFVLGARSSTRVAAGECGPDGIAWAALPATDLALVLGRDNRPLRSRERAQLAALGRIAGTRHTELVMRGSREAHPSTSA